MIGRICWVIQACLVARLAESGDLVVTNVCQEIYHYKSIHISLSVNLANLTQKTPSFSIWANLYYISLFNFFSIVLKYYYFPSPHNFAHSHQPFPYFPQKKFSLLPPNFPILITKTNLHLLHWQPTNPPLPLTIHSPTAQLLRHPKINQSTTHPRHSHSPQRKFNSTPTAPPATTPHPRQQQHNQNPFKTTIKTTQSKPNPFKTHNQNP